MPVEAAVIEVLDPASGSWLVVYTPLHVTPVDRGLLFRPRPTDEVPAAPVLRTTGEGGAPALGSDASDPLLVNERRGIEGRTVVAVGKTELWEGLSRYFDSVVSLIDVLDASRDA